MDIPAASVAEIISSLDGFSLKISRSVSGVGVSSGSRLEIMTSSLHENIHHEVT